MFISPSTESSGEHVSPVTATISSQASLSDLNVTVHMLFSASTRPTGQLEGRGEGGQGHWLGESPIGRLALAVETYCLHVLDPDRLSAARWVAVLFVCSLCSFCFCLMHWQYLCRGPEACTRTDATMTLQLYVMVVPCSQTGWIETTGLKNSGWKHEWRVTSQRLLL